MTSRKTWIFRLLLLFLPLLLLALAELGLRLFNAFPQPPLFVQKIVNGQAVYQVNPYVARRYFPPDHAALPTLYPEIFAREKPANTFRIFCLGGSTTAGFPFDAQVPFPQQLRLLLTDAFRDHRFEVINLGLSAINSFSVLDLLPEVLEHDPDLILIYMGHNEFYGVYGSASTFSMGQSGGWIRFYLRLQKLRLVQMLRAAIQRLQPAAPPAENGESLMSRVVGDRAIPYRSEKYWQTLQNFRENYRQILQRCAGRGVPVIGGSLVSNVRDLPPFSARTAPHLTPPQRDSLQTWQEKGKALLAQGNAGAAATVWQKALALDSLDAANWFYLGKAHAGRGDSVAAAHYLWGAKDRDLIRFRASEDANRIVAELCREFAAGFADVQSAFRRASSMGLIGDSLICDHLHPNPLGYYLMARAFFDEMRRKTPLQNPRAGFSPPPAPYFVTTLDWDIGLLKIYRMIHRWPFPEKDVDFADYPGRGEPQSAKIAHEYIFRHQNWAKAHADLGEFYLQNGRFAKAREEFKAISAYYPDDANAVMQIARTYKAEQNWPAAAHFYRVATGLAPENGMAFYQLALAQRQLNQLAAARESMEKAAESPSLSPEQRLNARYYLAGFLAESGEVERARQILKELTTRYPDFQPARIFLQQLESRGGP